MSCSEIREDLGAYLDGELDAARRSELASHLDSCADCRAELERLRRLSGLLRGLPQERAPEGLARRIVGALALGSWRGWTGALGAAAAIALAAVVGLTVTRESSRAPAIEAPTRSAAEAEDTAPLVRKPSAVEGTEAAAEAERQELAATRDADARPPALPEQVSPREKIAPETGRRPSMPLEDVRRDARAGAMPPPSPGPRSLDERLIGSREAAPADRAGQVASADRAAGASPAQAVIPGASSGKAEPPLPRQVAAKGLPAPAGEPSAATAAGIPPEAWPAPSLVVHVRSAAPAAELARLETLAAGHGGELVADRPARTGRALGGPDLQGGAGPQEKGQGPHVTGPMRVKVRLPRERVVEFLASVERLTLDEAEPRAGPDALAAGKSAEDRAPAARPSPEADGAARREAAPGTWVAVEIVIEADGPAQPRSP